MNINLDIIFKTQLIHFAHAKQTQLKQLSITYCTALTTPTNVCTYSMTLVTYLSQLYHINATCCAVFYYTAILCCQILIMERFFAKLSNLLQLQVDLVALSSSDTDSKFPSLLCYFVFIFAYYVPASSPSCALRRDMV